MTTMNSNESVLKKSIDHVNMIACMLDDVYNALGMLVPPRYVRLTTKKVANRIKREGYGFFTKSLSRLGKALDKALLGQSPLDCTGFRKESGAQFPKLFGNLFERVFDLNGMVLPNPCVESIRSLRQLLYCYYKYELPNDRTLDDKAIKTFETTEEEVRMDVDYLVEKFGSLGGRAIPPNAGSLEQHCSIYPDYKEEVALLRRARKLVYRLFSGFDVSSITPRHGPGVVSTKEKGAEKYVFDRINPRAQVYFPVDRFNFVNADHLCDALQELNAAEVKESDAQVVLVPKDSRGPRVISCEPLENQWLQQGIMRAMVPWIETHPLTRNDISFTDQEPNRMAALAGSYHGELATLDLKEASDRVSVWLVESLFPEPLLGALLATRSLATKLPDGKRIPLAKFAPMGSACCFPVLAVCVWAILRAGRAGADGKTVLVYGDDVIVETAEAVHAINQLEAFGLHVNRDKSCYSGLFRESCGLDAYFGADVTPVRFRTVWTPSPRPGPYESWIAYANSLFTRGYTNTASYIASMLQAVYGPIPVEQSARLVTKLDFLYRERISKWSTGYPCLIFDNIGMLPVQVRNSEYLPADHKLAGVQRLLKRVRTVTSRRTESEIDDGWRRLLRWFTEKLNELDTTTVDIVKAALDRLTQMGRRSRHDILDTCHPDSTNAELAEVADVSVSWDKDGSILPYLSSLTGIPLPVVQRAVREEVLRCVEREQSWVQPEPDSGVCDLGTYVRPDSTKLCWSWR